MESWVLVRAIYGHFLTLLTTFEHSLGMCTWKETFESIRLILCKDFQDGMGKGFLRQPPGLSQKFQWKSSINLVASNVEEMISNCVWVLAGSILFTRLWDQNVDV